ncbi:MAG: class I SAM-dependent methyltransferase [Dehalococcoidia bacterium]
MGIREAFDAGAPSYDAQRRKLIPCFDDFYGVSVELAPFPPGASINVLDLGAGTGLMSQPFARAFPNATFTLTDFAAEMLARAEGRFAAERARFTFENMDYATEPLPPGPFDLVISALSVHHLDGPGKAALFRRVYDVLLPGGAFINADEALAPTPWLEDRAQAAWQAAARRNGATDEELRTAVQRMHHDQPDTLDDQLRWLREAGFEHVDCAYKYYMYIVYAGHRPA